MGPARVLCGVAVTMAMAMATVALGAELPACATDSAYALARSQYGVTAVDHGGEAVRARAVWKKWAVSDSVSRAFNAADNWLALDTLKHTVCGPVDDVELFGHLLSGDEADVHFMVAPDATHRDTLKALAEAGASVRACEGALSCDYSIYSEVTPNRAFESSLCGSQQCREVPPGGPGSRPRFGGADWKDVRDVCVHGPFVLERFHALRPEIHPSEVLWAREGNGRRILAVVRDASRRMDQAAYFSAWPHAPIVSWSAKAADPTATFDVWFLARPGEPVVFSVAPPGEPAAAGAPRSLTNTGDLDVRVSAPQGLDVSVVPACREGGAIAARLSLVARAQQGRTLNRSGRDGASQAVAWVVSRTGGADVPEIPNRPSAEAERAPEPDARKAAVDVEAESAPLALDVRYSTRQKASTDPLTLTFDAFFTGGAQSAAKDAIAERSGTRARRSDELNALRTSKEGWKAAVGSGGRMFTAVLDLEAVGAAAPPRFRRLKFPIQSCAPLRDVIEYRVVTNAATELTVTSAGQAIARVQSIAGLFDERNAETPIVTAQFCTPPGVSVRARADVESPLAHGVAGRAEVSPTTCPAGDNQIVARADDIVRDALKDEAGVEAFLGLEAVRMLELARGAPATPEDWSPRRIAGRHLYAFALSMASECGKELTGHGFSGARLIRELWGIYVGRNRAPAVAEAR